MARRQSSYSPEAEIPPSLSPGQAKQVLTKVMAKGQEMLATRPIPEPAFDTWNNSAFDYIKKAFGSHSDHLRTFAGQVSVEFGDTPEPYREATRFKKLQEKIEVLQSLVQHIDFDDEISKIGTEESTPKAYDFWSLLHPTVVSTAKQRFDGGHYADAVEAALKELNSKIKEYVKRKSNEEFDGSSLMQKALSVDRPLITLADLSSESGRDIQKGYLQIFSGAMTGIRNPKAHENLQISRERSIHHLFLASLLFNVFDERI